MPGPKPKYKIELTTEEEKTLRQLAHSRKAPQGVARRARIVLAAYDHPEWSNQRIAKETGAVDRVVRLTRSHALRGNEVNGPREGDSPQPSRAADCFWATGGV